MGTDTTRDTAAMSAKVKATEALAIEMTVQTGATLPQAVTAALRVARHLQCVVTFAWEKSHVAVGPEDTYQGVQRRVGRAKITKR